MGLSADVRLPRSQAPKFPDRCVVCGGDSPDTSITVSSRSVGWWTWFFWLPGWRFAVQAPACGKCRARFLHQWWSRWLLNVAIVFSAVFLIAPWFSEWPRPVRKWVALGVVLLAVSPWFLWQLFFPPPLDLTVYTDTVDYEFKDEEYAAEFAALNAPRIDVEDQADQRIAEEA